MILIVKRKIKEKRGKKTLHLYLSYETCYSQIYK